MAAHAMSLLLALIEKRANLNQGDPLFAAIT
jgi:hypothetical protein